MGSADATFSEPPLQRWEHELGQTAGRRFLDRAIAALCSGAWRADDLEAAIERAEPRLTAAQRDDFWSILTADAELAELAARVDG